MLDRLLMPSTTSALHFCLSGPTASLCGVLQVITGVGKHSINGRPKILPAVLKYLSDSEFCFTEAFGNSGVLEVYIKGQTRAFLQ